MSSLAEFERDILKERVRSGLVVAKAKGKKLGRQKGDCPKAQKFGTQVLKLVSEGKSYRNIASQLHLSKNIVMSIVKESRVAAA